MRNLTLALCFCFIGGCNSDPIYGEPEEPRSPTVVEKDADVKDVDQLPTETPVVLPRPFAAKMDTVGLGMLPVIATDGETFFVGWNVDNVMNDGGVEAYGQVFALDGTRLTPPFAIQKSSGILHIAAGRRAQGDYVVQAYHVEDPDQHNYYWTTIVDRKGRIKSTESGEQVQAFTQNAEAGLGSYWTPDGSAWYEFLEVTDTGGVGRASAYEVPNQGFTQVRAAEQVGNFLLWSAVHEDADSATRRISLYSRWPDGFVAKTPLASETKELFFKLQGYRVMVNADGAAVTWTQDVFWQLPGAFFPETLNLTVVRADGLPLKTAYLYGVHDLNTAGDGFVGVGYDLLGPALGIYAYDGEGNPIAGESSAILNIEPPSRRPEIVCADADHCLSAWPTTGGTVSLAFLSR